MCLRIIRATALAALGFALAACGGDTPTSPAAGPVSIRIDNPSAVIEVGQAARIAATPTDAAGAPLANVAITYLSDHPGVAAVDEGGTVTGVAPGLAQITVAAGSARGFATVEVRPRGALTVAGLALHVQPDAQGARVVNVARWSLSPIGVSFTATNALGQEICGSVRLAVEVGDSTVLGATQQPLMRPCLVVLSPRGEGQTRVRISAGGHSDQVEVNVSGGGYRVVFGTRPGPVTVGSTVRYDVFVAGPGGPAAGVEFTVGGGYDLRTANALIGGYTPGPAPVTVVTDATGFAQVTWTAPTSTRFTAQSRTDCIGYVCRSWQPRWGPPFVALATGTLPDGTSVRLADSVQVVPGAPARVEVYAARCHWFEPLGYEGACDLEHAGDTVAVGTWTMFNYTESSGLAAAAVDAYGNPQPIAPAVHAPPGTLAPVAYDEMRGWTLEYWVLARWNHPGSRIAYTTLAAPATSTQVTVDYPGLPSRTVTLVLRPGATLP
jgi:hypothetical protein